MTARPVVEELAEAESRLREIRATPCVSCGHTYGYHDIPAANGRCCNRDWSVSPPVDCKCRRFRDPVEVLTP